jgi:hypothetical protein
LPEDGFLKFWFALSNPRQNLSLSGEVGRQASLTLSGKVPLATAENWEAGARPALPPQR